jgi:hypothetical protein
MRLSWWRGANVLVTSGGGLPVLQLGPAGNVVEWSQRPPPAIQRQSSGGGSPLEGAPVELASGLESLASSVASWILFNADDPGEFRADDIHPEIRDRVLSLVPDCVEA